MNTVSVSASIYEVTENILNLLTGDLSASSTKAYLASLRRSGLRDENSFSATTLCLTPTGKGAACTLNGLNARKGLGESRCLVRALRAGDATQAADHRVSHDYCNNL